MKLEIAGNVHIMKTACLLTKKRVEKHGDYSSKSNRVLSDIINTVNGCDQRPLMSMPLF